MQRFAADSRSQHRQKRRLGEGERPFRIPCGSRSMSDARGSLGSELAATLPTQNAEGPSNAVDVRTRACTWSMCEQGAHDLFGLSTGAVVSLGGVLGTTSVTRLALYEPPLSVDGSTPLGWTERYEREIAAGKTSSALITGMRGLHTDRVMSRIPHAAAPLMEWMLRRERPEPGDVAIRDLVPTFHYDIAIIERDGRPRRGLRQYSSGHTPDRWGKEPGVSRPLPRRTGNRVAQLPSDNLPWTRTSGCSRPTRSRRRHPARLLQGLRRHDITAACPAFDERRAIPSRRRWWRGRIAYAGSWRRPLRRWWKLSFRRPPGRPLRQWSGAP